MAPSSSFWICCPQLPCHPCNNGTHSTSSATQVRGCENTLHPPHGENLGQEKVFPRINLSSQVFAEVRMNFSGSILTKTLYFVNRRPELFRKILGKSSNDSLLLEDFFGFRKTETMVLVFGFGFPSSAGFQGKNGFSFDKKGGFCF